MTIDDRVAKFFVSSTDVSGNGAVPGTASDCQVTHLIDGENYFGALRQEVDALKQAGTGNRFFYFTDWVLNLVDYAGWAKGGFFPSAYPEEVNTTAFHLAGSTDPFLDELAAMSAAGVDVRALPWVSFFVLSFKRIADHERYYNHAGTALSVDALRKKPGMAQSAVLNVLANPLGAIHLKMVVCGDDTNARGYVAGIDIKDDRIDTQDHPSRLPGLNYGWHDIGAKVEGPAVDFIYKYFKALWDEQISRPIEKFRIDDVAIATHSPDCQPVPPRTFLPIPDATKRVQVLRTAPQFNLGLGPLDLAVEADAENPSGVKTAGCALKLLTGFRRPNLSFAPDGLFEFHDALKKAIGAAQRYIYVEDQAFIGREIMEWIGARLIAQPALKVIFLWGVDPSDPPSGRVLLNMAVNEHLAAGVVDSADRVAFHIRGNGIVVHSKTWIIDDEFVIIGSANAMRRSLYTDAEMSVGVLDENEPPDCFAVKYRCDLWAEHCRPADPADFIDLDAALQIWHPSWSTGAPKPGSLKPEIQRRKVPFVMGPASDEFPTSVIMPLPGDNDDRRQWDLEYETEDADSRKLL